MNIQGILIGTPANLSAGTDEVVLGPIMSEGENHSSSATSHAVEDGSDVSDHVSSKPGTFSIKTILVDRNLTDYVGVTQMSRLVTDRLFVGEKIDKLKKWKDDGEMLTYNGPVFSGLINPGYNIIADNVVITGVSISRSPDTGAGVEVTISLQKITIARSMTQDVKLPQAAKSAQSKGQTEKSSTSAAPKSQSILTKWAA